MIEVIPSINAPDFAGVKEQITAISPHTAWCHFDITDGVFSTHPTWRNPADLALLDTPLSAEVHLMVVDPEKIIDQWLLPPIKRVIVHLEAVKDMEVIIKKCRTAGIQVGLAIKPETFWGITKPWLDKVDLIQILAVPPGPSGQTISQESVDKIAHLRNFCEPCIIEVDGGINPKTAEQARRAGANILVAGSYIFGSKNIPRAIGKLKGEGVAGMPCPSCGFGFKEIRIDHIVLDECRSCGGIWFEHDELRLLKDAQNERLGWLDTDLFADPIKIKAMPSSLLCPTDDTPLARVTYDGSDIKVDVCSICKGVWLNKGELEQILSFLESKAYSQPLCEYARSLGEELKDILIGQEPIVSEIKDVYVVGLMLQNRIASQWPNLEHAFVALRSALLK